MAGQPYPQYESECGWNALLPRGGDPRRLDRETTADVIVVGAGFTGIAAARSWAARRGGDRILLLDASRIGEGNPGRNSGFLLEIALANDADAADIERMRACNDLIGRTMKRLRDDVYDAGIGCDIERAGTYRAAVGDAGAGALDDYKRFLDAAALPYELLSRDEIEQRLGTRYYREGLYSPHCYLVQPAALIRGLAGLLPESVELCEESPAVSLKRDSAAWRVATPGGAARAPVVIVANNAFAKDLGLAASRVAAMYTYAALTEPLAASALSGAETTWGLLPTHRLGCTLRRTRDDRLLIRSHYGYEREDDNDRVGRSLLASLKLRFPALEADRFDKVWSGATGFTRNGSPVWGRLREGLYVSAGCNGGGVVKGMLFGELLADHALGLEVPDVAALFGAASWMPPEPLRRLGFEIISRIQRRRAGAEM